MDIAPFISDLLRDHSEVSLPGIGTFYKEKVSARYDHASGLLNPPSEAVIFKAGDSGSTELIQYVSAAKKISEASSRYFINKYIDSVNQLLLNKGQAELSSLGLLKMGAEGLSLEPVFRIESSFGLYPVKDPAHLVTGNENAGTEQRKIETKTYHKADEEDLEQPKRSHVWQAVAAIVILLGIAGGLTYMFYPEVFELKADKPLIVNKQAAPAPVIALPDSSIQTDTLATPVVETAKTAPVVKHLKDSAKAETALHAPVAAPSPRYEIIGASLALRSEAETYLKLMKSKGVKAKILEDTHKPKFKISLGSYNTYEEANQEKRRIQTTFNKEAWIYTLKDKVKQ